MNRLTTAFECVPAFALVPINRPRIPCSNCHPRIGAYSIPNTSRWRSRRYSVNDSVFQSSISRLRQSFAGASLRVDFRLLIPIPPLLRRPALHTSTADKYMGHPLPHDSQANRLLVGGCLIKYCVV